MVRTFIGTYYRNLDNKGRLLLPAQLLGKERPALYLLRGFDGCVSVYVKEDYDALIESLRSLDFRNPEDRAYIRNVTASASPLKFDSVGRILLEKDVCREYGLETEITIIGVLDHFEIWDRKAYAAYVMSNGSFSSQANRRS